MAVASGLRSALARKLRPRSNMDRLLLAGGVSGSLAGHVHHSPDDAGVTGASAQMAAEHVAEFRLGWFRDAFQIIGERHQDTGGAEAALQRVVAVEGVLKRRHPALLGKALDCI